MQEKSSLLQSLERLSTREKSLVLALGFMVAAIALFGIGYTVSNYFDSLRSRNARQAKVLLDIKRRAPAFAKLRKAVVKEQDRIRHNTIRHIQDELAKILRKNGISGIEWRNPRREPLVKKVSRKRRKTFRHRVELLERRFVLAHIKFNKLFTFLEQIQKSPKLLLIKELKITKDPRKDDEARRVEIIVATYKLMRES